jgi:hypothetical protein
MRHREIGPKQEGESGRIPDLIESKPASRSKVQKKVKVVFVCATGEESSPLGRNMLESVLEAREEEGAFDLWSAGFYRRDVFKVIIKDADYIVPMASHENILAGMREMVKASGSNAVVIDAGLDNINKHDDRRTYERLLEQIRNIMVKRKSLV